VEYGAKQVQMALLYAGTNDAHMRSLAEAKRRSSVDKLRNLSSLNIPLYSSHQSVEKQTFLAQKTKLALH
jgi:hypothetical protein